MAMKKITHVALVLAGAFLFTQTARAQFTAVSATVVDPNGIPYAGGTVSAVLVPASPGNWTLSGNSYGGRIGTTSLDSTGSFTVQFGSNAIILPGGSQWQITVNSNLGGIPMPMGTGGQSFTVTMSISGSTQNISTTLNAAAPKLTNLNLGTSLFTLTSPASIAAITQQFLVGPPRASYDAGVIQSAFNDSPFVFGMLNQPNQIMSLRVIDQQNTPGQVIGGFSSRTLGNAASGTTAIQQALEGDTWCQPGAAATTTFCIGSAFQAHATGAGAVGNTVGMLIYSTTFGGVKPTSNYGILIQDQSGVGSSLNYGIYELGTAPNFFGGTVNAPALQYGPVTLASLGAAAAGNKGQTAVLSDSTAVASEGQTCVGSSTNAAIAFSNGTIWKCF